MKTAKVIPATRYVAPDGRKFSPFSTGIPEGSKLEQVGFTIAWNDGTTGCGRPPFQTEVEAQAFLDRNKNFPGMSQG